MSDTAGLREAGDPVAEARGAPDVMTTLSLPQAIHARLLGVAAEHGCAPADVYRLAIFGWLESQDRARRGDPAGVAARDGAHRLRYGIDPLTGDRTLANQYWDAVRSEAVDMLGTGAARRRDCAEQLGAAMVPDAGEIFARLRGGGRI